MYIKIFILFFYQDKKKSPKKNKNISRRSGKFFHKIDPSMVVKGTRFDDLLDILIRAVSPNPKIISSKSKINQIIIIQFQ